MNIPIGLRYFISHATSRHTLLENGVFNNFHIEGRSLFDPLLSKFLNIINITL
jgi:hypothetical protein